MNALFRLLRISCADRLSTQGLLVDSYKQNAFGKNILEPLFQGVFHSLTFAPYIRFVTSLCLCCNFGEARFARVNRFRMKLSPMKHFGAPRFLSNTHIRNDRSDETRANVLRLNAARCGDLGVPTSPVCAIARSNTRFLGANERGITHRLFTSCNRRNVSASCNARRQTFPLARKAPSGKASRVIKR